MGQSLSRSANPSVPKLHFVWAGGGRLLPGISPNIYSPNLPIQTVSGAVKKDNVTVILEWARKNPGMRVCLWIDEKSLPKETDLQNSHNLSDFYKRFFREKGIEIEVRDIADEFSDEKKYPLYPLIRYEIDKLTPNYGASSDLIRYSILHKYGGAVYLDSDVYVNPNVRVNAFTDFVNQGIHRRRKSLYVYDNSQGGGLIGNDIFFSTHARHSVVAEIIDFIIKNSYSKAFFELDKSKRLGLSQDLLAFFYNERNKKNNDLDTDAKRFVIEFTGPKLIRSLITDADGNDITPAAAQKGVKPLPHEYISDETTNFAGWTRVNIKRCHGQLTVAQILEKCRNAMSFEIEHWGIFCLDDYYRDGMELSDNSEEFKEGYVALLDELWGKYKGKVDVVKLTYEYPLTREWSHQNSALPFLKRQTFDAGSYSELSLLVVAAGDEAAFYYVEDYGEVLYNEDKEYFLNKIAPKVRGYYNGLGDESRMNCTSNKWLLHFLEVETDENIKTAPQLGLGNFHQTPK